MCAILRKQDRHHVLFTASDWPGWKFSREPVGYVQNWSGGIRPITVYKKEAFHKSYVQN